MADEKIETVEPVVEQPQVDPKITELNDQVSKLTAERDNFKTVAMKRLGKLPGDAEYLETADKETGLTVQEQINQALIQKELDSTQQHRDSEFKRIALENAELKLALKNRPGTGLGGSGGSSTSEVKDNNFSEQQLAELRKTAARLKTDPDKFIENFRKNLRK